MAGPLLLAKIVKIRSCRKRSFIEIFFNNNRIMLLMRGICSFCKEMLLLFYKKDKRIKPFTTVPVRKAENTMIDFRF